MNSSAAHRHGAKREAIQRSNQGFTYLGLLIMVTIIGLTSSSAVHVGSVLQRRAAEEELLAIGMEFRNALISYANSTPIGQNRFPRSLHDLLDDPRYPGTRRYLRKIYVDPLTGKEEWGIIQMPGGNGIAGIHSLSVDTPIKVGNFDEALKHFDGKTSYHEWVFTIDVQPLPSEYSGSAGALKGMPVN